jgi:hypothetical protein
LKCGDIFRDRLRPTYGPITISCYGDRSLGLPQIRGSYLKDSLTDWTLVDYTKNITYEIKLVSSKWTKVYSVVDATANEIANRINAEWIVVREKRNQLLRDTDYTQLEDVSLSYADKDKYKQYRKALREITETFSNPFDVVFPIL